MRAIVRCNTTLARDDLEKAFWDLKWRPPLPANNPEVVRHRDGILSLVAQDDTEIVRATAWFMIYDHTSKSWGLVNSPQEGWVEIRLRNQSSPKLRKACERLVSDAARTGKINFDPTHTIEVLEPNSQHQAYFGQALPSGVSKKIRLAILERRAELKLGILFVTLAVVCAIATIPPVEERVRQVISNDWASWGEGMIGRLATSAFASAAVFFGTVIVHFLDLRRRGAIRWSIIPRDMGRTYAEYS